MSTWKAARLILTAGAISLGLAGAALAQGLSIEAVSNRADMISGGDVLVRVMGSADASLSLNGAPSQARLQPAPDGRGSLALVTGLTTGKNALAVTANGRTAKLSVTNHPSGGPLFSGPQITPWPCLAGAVGAQCDRPSTYSYSYLPTGAREFKAYDPAAPARDVARITTDGGASLPFIVRIEIFNQNRSGVAVAALFDPARPWTAMQPQPQWNKGVLVLQGAGCGTGYGEQPAGSPLNERALSKGFVVVAVALLHNTINCNPVVQAEAALMAKEHVTETYGVPDIVFGMGSSGGAISQLMDQNAYPGLYDGLILNHLFADSDASRNAAYDCRLAYDAMAKSGAWTDAQKSAVVGQLSGCNSAPTRFEIYDPAIGTGCTVPDADKFNAKTNPKGVRCTLQDYQANIVGRRKDGAAYGRLDNEGVQYGLAALNAGTITPAQFVALNAGVGGHDINFQRTMARTRADRAGLKALYAAGINNTLNNLSKTAIIETRLNATDFHQPFHAVMVRARLMRAQGHHDNYALWRSTTAQDTGFANDSFDVMVQWLRAIKADTRAVPKAQKVIDNRPTQTRDRCTLGDGKDQPLTACPRPLPLTRVLAGAPDTNDLGKCQLKRLERRGYGAVVFTDAEWASLRGTFPTGVCDYARPMVEFGMTAAWRAYRK